jgi:tRNA (cytidine/uridine-2'-O-)-methyltransferase
MDLNIVLVAPEIPQNTGSIGRMCVCLDARLHLIEPLGFKLDETHLRRAGLDYWPDLDVTVHEDWPAFIETATPARLFFSTTKSERPHWEFRFTPGDYLVFGNESGGLPPSFYEAHKDNLYTIPMPGEHARSHNLASAVAVIAHEALRQFTMA